MGMGLATKEVTDIMVMPTLLAVLIVPMYIVVQYRYARLGLPPSIGWRIALFLTGALTGTAVGWLLVVAAGGYYPLNRLQAGDVVMSVFITGISGGVLSTWVFPRGTRIALEEAERNRRMRKGS